MKLVVDAHAFLWYHMADPRLSATAHAAVLNVQNQLLLSMASLWEIAIKVSIGKLSLPGPFETLIPSQMQLTAMQVLDVRFQHVARVIALPFHHNDPFDRILAAQCLVENLPLLSRDTVFDQYGVQRIW